MIRGKSLTEFNFKPAHYDWELPEAVCPSLNFPKVYQSRFKQHQLISRQFNHQKPNANKLDMKD